LYDEKRALCDETFATIGVMLLYEVCPGCQNYEILLMGSYFNRRPLLQQDG